MNFSNGVKIRFARPEDAPALARIYAYYVLNTAVTYEYDVPTTSEFERRIGAVSKAYPYFVAEREGRVVGYAYASAFGERRAFAWTAETAVYVDAEEGRSGVGSLLYAALEAALKEQGIVNVCARISCLEQEDEYITHASYNFHKKHGYSLCGRYINCGCKFGRWYDLLWMTKSLSPHTRGMAEPVPFPQVKAAFCEKYKID